MKLVATEFKSGGLHEKHVVFNREEICPDSCVIDNNISIIIFNKSGSYFFLKWAR